MSLLETEGLIDGQVGRGSFVRGSPAPPAGGMGWAGLLERGEPGRPPVPPAGSPRT